MPGLLQEFIPFMLILSNVVHVSKLGRMLLHICKYIEKNAGYEIYPHFRGSFELAGNLSLIVSVLTVLSFQISACPYKTLLSSL
jgi:hypothetical protein